MSGWGVGTPSLPIVYRGKAGSYELDFNNIAFTQLYLAPFLNCQECCGGA